jgi:hypothetical protein
MFQAGTGLQFGSGWQMMTNVGFVVPPLMDAVLTVKFLEMIAL